MKTLFKVLAVSIFVFVSPSFAANKKIKGTLVDADGQRIVALASTGAADTAVESKFNLTTDKDGKTQLFVVNSDGTAFGPVVFAIKKGKKVYSYKQAIDKGVCESAKAMAVMGVKVGAKAKNKKRKRLLNVKKVTLNSEQGFAYTGKISKRSLNLKQLADVNSECVPAGAGKLGVPTEEEREQAAALVTVTKNGQVDSDADGVPDSEDPDQDNDGMPNVFDADDDNDGILDNDDPDARNQPIDEDRSFWVFSNMHTEMARSLNLNAASVNKAQIDALMQSNGGLAMQVIGEGAYDVELICDGLTYCSAGGTGSVTGEFGQPLPFPEDFDDNGDGYGSIEPGSTGDFQLRTGATSDEIKAGDVYVQRVVDDKGNTYEVPSMLNFIFQTMPAVKTVVTGVQTYNVTYPVQQGDPGTDTNCFKVPASGDVKVTLTVWRPQRKGIIEAGEAEYMDMGNLILVTNLPNAPEDPNSGEPDGGANPETLDGGPGMCPSSVYTSSDPNLTVVDLGLQDNLGDTPTDPSNTFEYTIDLSACLSGAGIDWNPGKRLHVPVQMVNQYNDNATQDICFIREAS